MEKAKNVPIFEELENRLMLNATISTDVPGIVAPGIEYDMYVMGDNTGLNPEVTEGVQWRLGAPSYMNVQLGGSGDGLPTLNDFFEGFDMWSGFNFVKLPGQLSARATDILSHPGDYGPSNKIGRLGEYKFIIDSDYPGPYLVQDSFSLSDEKFLDTNADLQSLVVQNIPFTIASLGDTDTNGDVSGVDLAALGLNWDPAGGNPGNDWSVGNFDGDGDVDGTDLASLGLNWAPAGYGAESLEGKVIGTTPEPSTIGFIGLGLSGLAWNYSRRKRRKK